MQRLNVLMVFIVVALIISCATVVAPPGGPEDKLPPRVSGLNLTPNSVNQSTELDITLQFDEWIMQKPPNGSVVISPPIEGRLRLKANGDKLRIYSNEPLDSNTTYALTVTNAINDLRSNPLEKPFQILFSTGSVLDSLKTNFSVHLQDSLIKRKKFPVVAFYPIGSVRAGKNYLKKFRDSTIVAEQDTFPNIIKEIPQYIAQTDSLGNGVLQGMQKGFYLAAAFLDENNNQKIDATSEIAGISPYPFELKEVKENEEIQMLNFSLGDLDTTSVSLDDVSQRGNNEIEFAFSRDIIFDSLFLQKGNCFLTTPRDTIFHSNFYIENNTKNPVFILDGLKNDTLYTAKCLYASDSLGRMLDTAINSAKFRFKSIPEKEIAGTYLSKKEPKDSSDVLPEQPIKLYYNHPISVDTLNFRLYVNEDSVKIDVKQINAATLEINPIPKFATDSRIKFVSVKKDTIIDTLFNEGILMQFSTISKLKLASLKGEIPGGNAQTIVIFQETTINKLSKSSIKTLGRKFTAKCEENGSFEIKNIPTGTYQVMYFKDFNNDGRLTSGSLWPIIAGEPWAAPKEELILPYGDDNYLKELLKDLPELK